MPAVNDERANAAVRTRPTTAATAEGALIGIGLIEDPVLVSIDHDVEVVNW
jgi:hypothetical protein